MRGIEPPYSAWEAIKWRSKHGWYECVLPARGHFLSQGVDVAVYLLLTLVYPCSRHGVGTAWVKRQTTPSTRRSCLSPVMDASEECRTERCVARFALTVRIRSVRTAYRRRMGTREPLRDDPIGLARDNWCASGWSDAAEGMAIVTSIMRVQQILLADVEAALKPFRLTFARYEVLMLLRFARRRSLPVGTDRRTAAGASGERHERRRPTRARRFGRAHSESPTTDAACWRRSPRPAPRSRRRQPLS